MFVNKIKMNIKEEAAESKSMQTKLKMKIDVVGNKLEISELVEKIYDAIYRNDK